MKIPPKERLIFDSKRKTIYPYPIEIGRKDAAMDENNTLN
jgi:hypothetical protein